MQIRILTAAETHPLRLAILRVGMPPESAIFPGDDAPDTRHFGAFENGALTGIATILRAPLPEQPAVAAAWQLRGMATVPAVRGRGCGLALLDACAAYVRENGGAILWCNARTPALGFYRKAGFETIGGEFEIPTAGPHFRMMRKMEE